MPVPILNKANRLIKAHPYAVGGIVLASTVGLGVGGSLLARSLGFREGYRVYGKRGNRGLVENGMLKEAIGRLRLLRP